MTFFLINMFCPPIFSAQIEGESQFWETWGIMPMRVEPFQPQRPNTGRQKDLAAHRMPAGPRRLAGKGFTYFSKLGINIE